MSQQNNLKRDDKDPGNMIEGSRQGDKKAREEMILAYQNLVARYAWRYQDGCTVTYQDLFQEGCIGLIKAAEHYRPNENVKFSGYAVFWIKKYMIQALEEQARAIRIPGRTARTVWQMYKLQKKYEKENGCEPSSRELAGRLGLSLEKTEGLIMLTRKVVSLDQTISDSSNRTVEMEVSDTFEHCPEYRIEQRELERILAGALDTLSEIEREVILCRFGFHNGKRFTLEEIGRRYHMTREGVRKIQNRALGKLRKQKEICNLQYPETAACRQA